MAILKERLPIAKVRRGEKELPIDVYEVKIDSSLFFEIFLGINVKEQEIPTNTQINDKEPSNILKEVKEKGRIGRKPLHIKYPDFTKENSFAAHSRRREKPQLQEQVKFKGH